MRVGITFGRAGGRGRPASGSGGQLKQAGRRDPTTQRARGRCDGTVTTCECVAIAMLKIARSASLFAAAAGTDSRVSRPVGAGCRRDRYRRGFETSFESSRTHPNRGMNLSRKPGWNAPGTGQSMGNAGWRFGGARRNRTADLLNAIQALSQLSYGPTGPRAARFGLHHQGIKPRHQNQLARREVPRRGARRLMSAERERP